MAFRTTADPQKFDEAVDFFASRFPITEELADALGQYAGDRAWTIAGVAQLEIVQEVYASLLEAIEKGTPFAEWQAAIQDKLTSAWGKRDSHRIETIFRNATQQSYNAGRWRQITDPGVANFRPYGEFDGIADSRQSDICRACDGTILPLDDPWWRTHSPQLHHRCRSRIRSLTERQARARGVTARPPSIAADEGFGEIATEASWEPDRSKYAPPIWNEYERKAERLEKSAGKTKLKPTGT